MSEAIGERQLQEQDRPFPTPWRYDDYGYVFAADGQLVAEVRGWGHLTGSGGGRGMMVVEATEIQDRIGNMLADAPALLDALHMLSMMGLQSDRYAKDADYRDAVDAGLDYARKYGRLS